MSAEEHSRADGRAKAGLRQGEDTPPGERLREEEFAEIVTRDAKGQATEEEARFLRSREVAGRWNAALAQLNRDLEAAFATRKAEAQDFQNECQRVGSRGKRQWFSYKAEYERWRADAAWLKGNVEGRLRESKDLLRYYRKESGPSRQRESEAHGPLLCEVEEFLSSEGAVTQGFSAWRQELLARISGALGAMTGRRAKAQDTGETEGEEIGGGGGSQGLRQGRVIPPKE